MIAQKAPKRDPRVLLAPIGNRTIRSVLRTDNEAANCIIDLVREDRTEWTLPEWIDTMSALLKCEDKIEDWLATRM